jgi:hypothetical protein
MAGGGGLRRPPAVRGGGGAPEGLRRWEGARRTWLIVAELMEVMASSGAP